MRFLLIFSLLISSAAFAQTKATLKLFNAIEKNDISLAASAIREGADVNGVDRIQAPTTTVFHKAVQANRLEITKLLLDNKADVNQRRPLDLLTGLIIAAKYNLAPMTKLLIANGADVNIQALSSRTALHTAAVFNSIAAARELVKAKDIDVNIFNTAGLCALGVAARQNNKEIVILLKNQSGALAASPTCIEKAISVALLNEHRAVVQILRAN